ncbi:MAG: hypothetical protein IGR93_05735 [Hydrococcus sp. C42_A2020_068]|nr:hypothetical protein [Hydrococcus sp. C42_A2020_068]
MIISDLEHLEVVSQKAEPDELNQVNGGLIQIAAFGFSLAQGQSFAGSIVNVKTVAIALAPSFPAFSFGS